MVETVAVLLVGVVLVVLVTVLAVRSRRRPDLDALEAEPEDRPLAAVVVNPTKAEPGTRGQITDVCAQLGWGEPLWLETTVEDPGTGQARDALERGADVVMACGGDGTVRCVAEVLAGSSVAMGLVPAGTGNLLARTLGMSTVVRVAARVALTGDDRPIDVGWVRIDDAVNERAFLVMAGTGFDAAIMVATPEAMKERVGPLAYVISGLRGMRGRRTRVAITLDDGQQLRRSSRTVVIGNCGTLLGGLVLMPAAAIDDGLLDVVNLAPKGIPGWLAVAARVITRTRRGHRRVEHWQARTIVVEADEPQPSQLDGDPIGDASVLRVRTQRRALVVRVPASATAGLRPPRVPAIVPAIVRTPGTPRPRPNRNALPGR